MTVFVTRCKDCGAEFEPTQDAIRAGSWRLCDACRPQTAEQSRCRRCGRLLAGRRDLCLHCAGLSPL
jgi:uncharacterized OB-fold protein